MVRNHGPSVKKIEAALWLLSTRCKPITAWARTRASAIAFKCRHPKWFHWSHLSAHMVYFLGVFIEGHGMYSSVAGLLFIFGIAAVFMGETE